MSPRDRHQHLNRRQTAYRHVLKRLVANEYPPGRSVRELHLAKELHMSRAPIREALNQLANEGWIRLVPGRGVFVREQDPREIRELFGLRACLEGYAAQRAAKRIRPAQLEHLEKACAAMSGVLRVVKDKRLERLDEATALTFAKADIAFHTVVGKASANRQLQATMRTLRLLVRSGTHQPDPALFHLLTVLTTVYRFHRRILAALRRRDGRGAAKWMRAHVREARDRVLKQLNSPGAQLWPQSVLDLIAQGHTS
jgi:DNA-binding GntR family transcriptional regulator